MLGRILLLVALISESVAASELYACAFTQGAVTELTVKASGSHFTEHRKVVEEAPLSFIFFAGDDGKGWVDSPKNTGSPVPTQVVRGRYPVLSFVEVTGMGNVNTTTIFRQAGLGGTPELFMAVHSRHVLLIAGDTAAVSQYTGACGPMKRKQ